MGTDRRERSLIEGVVGLSAVYGNPRGESQDSLHTEAILAEFDDLLLSEGINDPYILKAVFMAGGGGSGKGWVSANMFSGMGLKVVNSDDILEAFSGNPQLRAKFKDLAAIRPGGTFDLGKAADMASPEIQQVIRPRAKQVAKGLLGLYMQGRLGLIIDSTGRQVDKVTTTKKALDEAGYDTSMVFVDVPIQTALARNLQRARKVPEDVLIKAHAEIRGNFGKFKSAFGGKFTMIDNSDIPQGTQEIKHGNKTYHVANLDAVTSAMRKAGTKLVSGAVKNPRGKEWIEAQKKLLALSNKKESVYFGALDNALVEGES
jgi:predicted kinase